MDIKLRARLTAYSKIETATDIHPSIPDAAPENSGSVLGVNPSGNYTFFPSVTREDIDSLFSFSDTDFDPPFPDDSPSDVSRISREEIDSLFNK